eukprot:COSAG06_NODE_13819_length_1216_cov_0.937332_3_plen_44_part_01
MNDRSLTSCPQILGEQENDYCTLSDHTRGSDGGGRKNGTRIRRC